MRNFVRQVLILLAAALVPAAGSAFFHPRRPSWNELALAPGEVVLQTALDWKDRVIWLDARSEVEYAQGHIPNAMLLNEDAWDDLLPHVLNAWNRDKIIVVYCSSLRCQASDEVAKRLREEAKLPNVYVLKGGWESWRDSKK